MDKIKTFGGMTSRVVTAHMLPYAGLSKLYFTNDSPSMGPFSLKRFYDEHFAVLQKASWAIVVYQIIRILALNRVTPRFYETCVSAAAAHPQSLLPKGLVRGAGGGGDDMGGLDSARTGLNSAHSARSALSQGGGSPRGSQAGGGGSEAGGSEVRVKPLRTSAAEKVHVFARVSSSYMN